MGTRTLNAITYVVLIVLLATASWIDAAGDIWLISGLAVCLFRFIVLNYVLNAIRLRKEDREGVGHQALRAKKWYLVGSRAELAGYDSPNGTAIIALPGMVAAIVALPAFLLSIYMSLEPEVLGQFFPYSPAYVYGFGVAVLVVYILLFLSKTKFAKS